MLRKIVIGTLFVALIGALIAGAVIRTSDRVSRVADGSVGQGQANNGTAAQGNGGRWEESIEGDLATNGGRGRSGNAGRADLTDRELGVGQAEVGEWITLDGTVTAVDEAMLSVTTASGETVVVENRAWSFAQEQGFSASPGDQIRLKGFYEDSDLEIGSIDDLSSGIQVQLREESGRPLWAGRGRGGA